MVDDGAGGRKLLWAGVSAFWQLPHGPL